MRATITRQCANLPADDHLTHEVDKILQLVQAERLMVGMTFVESDEQTSECTSSFQGEIRWRLPG